jgi:two-component system response regulator MprA
MQDADRGAGIILIAERDSSVRALQSHFLEAAGYRVVFAEDGEGAFALATELSPVLVVTEILIPKLDGLALCRQLRDSEITGEVPVLVFSILSAGARANEAGAQGFIRKPFVASTFLASVDQLVAPQQSISREA